MSARARAALDPEAALEAALRGEQSEVSVGRELVLHAGGPRPALTMSVEVEPPLPHSRWRFLLFYWLVKLAARVYPFHFEIYRTEQAIDREVP